MKIVITGGLGFVGVNLGMHFLSKGHEVIALDNGYKEIGRENNKNLLLNQGGKICYVDIRNNNDVEHFFQNEKQIGAVLHMAAQVAFKVSVENPRLDFEINALGTFNLLESIRKYHSQATFVCASTNQVYGLISQIPIREYETRFDFIDMPYGIPEMHPLDFLSPYGCSKGTADQYTLDYARIYGLNAVVTRFGGIYGDHQYSYEDHGWVAYMTKMLVANQSFNRFGHGKQVRDVLYISDIVNAIELCVHNIGKVKGQAINIAGGPDNTLSVLELLNLLEDITGHKEKSIINPMRTGDKVVAYLDIRKAKNLLGWEPQVAVKEGILNLVKWTNLHN